MRKESFGKANVLEFDRSTRVTCMWEDVGGSRRLGCQRDQRRNHRGRQARHGESLKGDVVVVMDTDYRTQSRT